MVHMVWGHLVLISSVEWYWSVPILLAWTVGATPLPRRCPFTSPTDEVGGSHAMFSHVHARFGRFLSWHGPLIKSHRNVGRSVDKPQVELKRCFYLLYLYIASCTQREREREWVMAAPWLLTAASFHENHLCKSNWRSRASLCCHGHRQTNP